MRHRVCVNDELQRGSLDIGVCFGHFSGGYKAGHSRVTRSSDHDIWRLFHLLALQAGHKTNFYTLVHILEGWVEVTCEHLLLLAANIPLLQVPGGLFLLVSRDQVQP